MSIHTNFVITCSDCGKLLPIPEKNGLLTKDNAIEYIKKKLKKLYEATYAPDTDHVVCKECKPLTRRKPKWAR